MAALFDGFRAKTIPEWQVASYMILIQLTAKKELSLAATEAVLEDITSCAAPVNHSHALLSVIYLCQRISSLERFTETVSHNILNLT
jgi:hypothetical protein